MNKLWSAVATFNILFLLNLFTIDRSNRSMIGVFNPAQNWSEVPLFGLSIGTLTTVISGYLLIAMIKGRPNYSGIDRLPSLWVEDLIDKSLNGIWKKAILFVSVILPILIQVHFWFRFHEWQAWTNHFESRDVLVSLYDYVSPHFLLDWDGHRYGDHSKLAEKGWAGISYVPFWQPILMTLLSVWSLIVTIRIGCFLFLSPKAELKKELQ